MKIRRFGLGRSIAEKRGETMLRRARLSFSNPNHSPRKQLEIGMNAMRYCKCFINLESFSRFYMLFAYNFSF